MSYLDDTWTREDLATGQAFVTTMKDIQRVVDKERIKARIDELVCMRRRTLLCVIAYADVTFYADVRIAELNKRLEELKNEG